MLKGLKRWFCYYPMDIIAAKRWYSFFFFMAWPLAIFREWLGYLQGKPYAWVVAQNWPRSLSTFPWQCLYQIALAKDWPSLVAQLAQTTALVPKKLSKAHTTVLTFIMQAPYCDKNANLLAISLLKVALAQPHTTPKDTNLMVYAQSCLLSENIAVSKALLACFKTYDKQETWYNTLLSTFIQLRLDAANRGLIKAYLETHFAEKASQELADKLDKTTETPPPEQLAFKVFALPLTHTPKGTTALFLTKVLTRMKGLDSTKKRPLKARALLWACLIAATAGRTRISDAFAQKARKIARYLLIKYPNVKTHNTTLQAEYFYSAILANNPSEVATALTQINLPDRGVIQQALEIKAAFVAHRKTNTSFIQNGKAIEKQLEQALHSLPDTTSGPA